MSSAEQSQGRRRSRWGAATEHSIDSKTHTDKGKRQQTYAGTKARKREAHYVMLPRSARARTAWPCQGSSGSSDVHAEMHMFNKRRSRSAFRR